MKKLMMSAIALALMSSATFAKMGLHKRPTTTLVKNQQFTNHKLEKLI